MDHARDCDINAFRTLPCVQKCNGASCSQGKPPQRTCLAKASFATHNDGAAQSDKDRVNGGRPAAVKPCGRLSKKAQPGERPGLRSADEVVVKRL
jgi:hypothetical protein